MVAIIKFIDAYNYNIISYKNVWYFNRVNSNKREDKTMKELFFLVIICLGICTFLDWLNQLPDLVVNILFWGAIIIGSIVNYFS